MRLNDQRNLLMAAADRASADLLLLQCRIQRKTAMPYGDGSYSSMVNANSDVLPQLIEIRGRIDAVLQLLRPDEGHRLARLKAEV
jgi:hypothetical protein